MIVSKQSFVFVYIVRHVQKRLSVFTEQKTKDHMCTRKTIYACTVYNNNNIIIYGPPTGPFSRVRPNGTMRVFELIEHFTWPDGTHTALQLMYIIYDMKHRPRKSWFVTPHRTNPPKKKSNNDKRSNVIRFAVIARV